MIIALTDYTRAPPRQLEAVLRTGAHPLPRPLPVDLKELADILEGDPTDSGWLQPALAGRSAARTRECVM